MLFVRFCRRTSTADGSVEGAGPDLRVRRERELNTADGEVERLEHAKLRGGDLEETGLCVLDGTSRGDILLEGVRAEVHERKTRLDNGRHGRRREKLGGAVVD